MPILLLKVEEARLTSISSFRQILIKRGCEKSSQALCPMSLSRWLLKFQSLKLQFWLPLPLLVIAFGLCGEALTNQLLSRSHGLLDKLQAGTQSTKVQLTVDVREIIFEIEKDENFTKVDIQTTNSVLKELEFNFPVTELSMVKAMIARDLGLSTEVEKIEADPKIKLQLSFRVLGILAEIQKDKGFTKVEVNTVNSYLTKLEFELPITELSMVKARLSRELGLSPEKISMLVSYRLKN